eukprot:tig00000403_g295.t1
MIATRAATAVAWPTGTRIWTRRKLLSDLILSCAVIASLLHTAATIQIQALNASVSCIRGGTTAQCPTPWDLRVPPDPLQRNVSIAWVTFSDFDVEDGGLFLSGDTLDAYSTGCTGATGTGTPSSTLRFARLTGSAPALLSSPWSAAFAPQLCLVYNKDFTFYEGRGFNGSFSTGSVRCRRGGYVEERDEGVWGTVLSGRPGTANETGAGVCAWRVALDPRATAARVAVSGAASLQPGESLAFYDSPDRTRLLALFTRANATAATLTFQTTSLYAEYTHVANNDIRVKAEIWGTRCAADCAANGGLCVVDQCLKPANLANWTCPAAWYGDGYCDCGCGMLDPDCPAVPACDARRCASAAAAAASATDAANATSVAEAAARAASLRAAETLANATAISAAAGARAADLERRAAAAEAAAAVSPGDAALASEAASARAAATAARAQAEAAAAAMARNATAAAAAASALANASAAAQAAAGNATRLLGDLLALGSCYPTGVCGHCAVPPPLETPPIRPTALYFAPPAAGASDSSLPLLGRGSYFRPLATLHGAVCLNIPSPVFCTSLLHRNLAWNYTLALFPGRYTGPGWSRVAIDAGSTLGVRVTMLGLAGRERTSISPAAPWPFLAVTANALSSFAFIDLNITGAYFAPSSPFFPFLGSALSVTGSTTVNGPAVLLRRLYVSKNRHENTQQAFSGGGGSINVAKSPSVLVEDCVFEKNEVVPYDESRCAVTPCGPSGFTASCFSYFTAHGGGLVIYQSNNVIVRNSDFVENAVGQFGGGLFVAGSVQPPTYTPSYNVSIVNCTFRENRAGTGGGGLAVTMSESVSVSDCIFDANRVDSLWPHGAKLDSAGAGALLWWVNNGSLSRSSFTGNRQRGGWMNLQDCGGGFAIVESNNTVVDSVTVVNNSATAGAGFAIAWSRGVTVSNSVIAGNTQTLCTRRQKLRWGGGAVVAASASVAFRNTTFADNRAEVWGGGFAMVSLFLSLEQPANFTCEGCRLHNNSVGADGTGGAVYSLDWTDWSFVSSAFEMNRGAIGGALYATSDFGTGFRGATGDPFSVGSLAACTFARNSATFRGGAAAVRAIALTVSDSAFKGNTAGSLGGCLLADAFRLASFTVSNSTFEGCSAYSGGAIYAGDLNSLRLSGGSVVRCSAHDRTRRRANDSESPLQPSRGAGLFLWNADSAVNGTLFRENRADSSGGGVYVGGDAGRPTALEAVTFLDNAATDAGGAVFAGTNAALSVAGPSTFRRNAAQSGGALWLEGQARVAIEGAAVLENRASHGAGIAVSQGATVACAACTLASNVAEEEGGGLLVEGAAFLALCIEAAAAVAPPGAFLGSELTDGALRGNVAATGGAAAVAEAAVTRLARCRVEHNTALASGGAVHAAGTANLTLRDSLLSHNGALENGGALLVSQAAVVDAARCAFASNSANQSGGACALEGGSSSLTNCSLAGNSAHEGGGALRVEPGASLALVSSSLENNRARYGGGTLLRAAACPAASLHGTSVRGNRAAEGGGAFFIAGPSAGPGGRVNATLAAACRDRILAGLTGPLDGASNGSAEGAAPAAAASAAASPWTTPRCRAPPPRRSRAVAEAGAPASVRLGATVSFLVSVLDAFDQLVKSDNATTVSARLVESVGPATLLGEPSARLTEGEHLFDALAVTSYPSSTVRLRFEAIGGGGAAGAGAGAAPAEAWVVLRACLRGEVQSPGSLVCTLCHPGTYSLLDGSQTEDGECKRCPPTPLRTTYPRPSSQGYECPGGASVYPSRGWWLVPDEFFDEAYQPARRALRGHLSAAVAAPRDPVLVPCFNGECLGGPGSSCSEGYSGPLCTVCAAGYGRNGNFRCIRCPERSALAGLTILGVVLILLVVWGMVSSSINAAEDRRSRLGTLLKIGWSYIQVQAMVADFNTFWPVELFRLFRAQAILSTPIDSLFSLDCILEGDNVSVFGGIPFAYRKFVAFLLMPLFCLAIALFFAAVPLVKALGRAEALEKGGGPVGPGESRGGGALRSGRRPSFASTAGSALASPAAGPPSTCGRELAIQAGAGKGAGAPPSGSALGTGESTSTEATPEGEPATPAGPAKKQEHEEAARAQAAPSPASAQALLRAPQRDVWARARDTFLVTLIVTLFLVRPDEA